MGVGGDTADGEPPIAGREPLAQDRRGATGPARTGSAGGL